MTRQPIRNDHDPGHHDRLSRRQPLPQRLVRLRQLPENLGMDPALLFPSAFPQAVTQRISQLSASQRGTKPPVMPAE